MHSKTTSFERPFVARVDAGTDDSLATRRSLLSRLRNLGDHESWHTFFETYWRLIYNVARRSGLSDDQAQEVVQETVIAVARKMPGFIYDPAKGSFKHWLLLISRRRIQDHFRRMYSSQEAARESYQELEGMIESVPEQALPPDVQVDADWERQWRDNVFQTALARVRQRVNPKSYQVFDCCVMRNMPAAAVARMLNLSAAQVYLAKHRVSVAVKRAAKEVEAEMNGGQSPAG